MSTKTRASPTLVDALAAPFDETHKISKGSAQLNYLATEQVVNRLNDVLGADRWQFEVREHGVDATGAWVLGRLHVYAEEQWSYRDQFGECAIQQGGRGMSSGDARKGAASDALKKCAWLYGVGLYLSHKDGIPSNGGPPPTPIRPSEEYGRPQYNEDLKLENPLDGLLWTKFVEPKQDEIDAFWDNLLSNEAIQFDTAEHALAYLDLSREKDVNDGLLALLRREKTDIRRLYKAIKICREHQMRFPNTAKPGGAD